MVSSEWLSASSTLIFLFSYILILWSSTNIDGICCQTNNNIIFPVDAVSDEKTDSKQALLDAWKKACAIDGGSMSVPLGSSLVASEVEFVGPCAGRTGFTLLGTLTAPPLPTAPNLDYWIKFHQISNLSISGNGTLNGNGASYWQITNRTTIITSLKLESIEGLDIRDITSVDSRNFHINVHNCQNVNIVNVHIRAPENSPNTDGIHVADSDSVRISHVDIGTGDDCISLGDGATNINITGVNCGPGHGISIGSLGKFPQEKEVQSVSVTDCTLTNTTNGLRIKTFGPSTPGSVSGITFQGIIVNNVKNPIIIDQHYCPHSQCVVGSGESSVAINGVKFIDVRGTSGTGVGVKFDCSKTFPCQHIDLTGLNLTFNGDPTTATCSFADVNFLQPDQLPSRCSNSSFFSSYTTTI